MSTETRKFSFKTWPTLQDAIKEFRTTGKVAAMEGQDAELVFARLAEGPQLEVIVRVGDSCFAGTIKDDHQDICDQLAASGVPETVTFEYQGEPITVFVRKMIANSAIRQGPARDARQAVDINLGNIVHGSTRGELGRELARLIKHAEREGLIPPPSR